MGSEGDWGPRGILCIARLGRTGRTLLSPGRLRPRLRSLHGHCATCFAVTRFLYTLRRTWGGGPERKLPMSEQDIEDKKTPGFGCLEIEMEA